jgi:hypothetical protein
MQTIIVKALKTLINDIKRRSFDVFDQNFLIVVRIYIMFGIITAMLAII